MAHILLKEAGYDIIEFNASEVRSQKIIRDKLLSVINGSNILQMINKVNKTAIIMDEVDGTSSGEKGVIKDLVAYIENAEKSPVKTHRYRNRKSSGGQSTKEKENLIINLNSIIQTRRLLRI